MTHHRKYLAFDIETVKEYPQGDSWRDHRPLGIACAAAQQQDSPNPITWYSANPDGTIADSMSQHDVQRLLQDLLRYTTQEGYTLVTWNGLGFDFDVLAEESAQFELCRSLALTHVDMMFHFLCDKGYPVALTTAAKGMNTQDKTEGMSGDLAPKKWAKGERQPVIDYCTQDVRATLDLALACEAKRQLNWTSRSGRANWMKLPAGWLPVEQANDLPLPDTSWMTDPLPREDFTAWLTLQRPLGP